MASMWPLETLCGGVRPELGKSQGHRLQQEEGWDPSGGVEAEEATENPVRLKKE